MAQPYLLPDYIFDRLDAAGLDARIRHIASLRGMEDQAQPAPAIYIVPVRISIADEDVATSPIFRESVMVAVATRYVNQPGGEGARQLAAPLMSSVISLLAGWKPTSAYTELRFETPVEQQYILGFGYYPLQVYSLYEVS